MRHLLKLLVPTIAASLLIAACGSSSSNSTTSSSASGQPAAHTSSGTSSVLVTSAANSTLGGTILVNGQSMTLYRLSGEQNGKFICTSSACLSVWHPVTASSSGNPSSSVGSLGTVRRPDGTLQVTYKGMPLYTFAQDQKPGEVKGQGLKDVGTWSVVTISSSSTAPSTSSTPATTTPSSSGGGYSY